MARREQFGKMTITGSKDCRLPRLPRFLIAASTIVSACLSAPFSVSAEEIKSVYTNFDADKCKHEPGTEEEDYGSWECPGYGGLPVLLAAGDQRMYVSFGKVDADDNFALAQTFPAFNDVYKGTVEWRLVDGRPFATILRWNVMTGKDNAKDKGPITPNGSVLVVTRLSPGGTCQIGYVDAHANADANELARKLADEHARDFRCGKDKPIVLGKTDPDLAMPKGD
jgi:hypothetical protein